METISTDMEFTQEELNAAREYKNKKMREWWGKQSAEERRIRRQRYAISSLRKRQAAASKSDQAEA